MDKVLPLLPTLVALSRTGSVIQSARELGVPRSTVSRRLARIEALLGVKVAERTTHRFTLTAAGRRLVDGAVSALAQLETVRERVVAVSSEVTGLVRLAMAPGMSGSFIGWFLASLRERHPGIDVELTVTDQRVIRPDEGFDLLLVMGVPEPSSWLRKRLTQDELIAVATPDYLERHGTPKSVEALETHVLLTSTSRGVTPRWPRTRGGSFPIRAKLSSNDLVVLREAALASMGIALLPSHVVLSELNDDRLVRVLSTQVGQTVDVFMLYLPERRASPVLRAILAAVTEFASLHS